MLDAAVTFAETLQDADRVAKVAKIRPKLEASIDEIVAHQSVLERKLAAQRVNYTHRRDKLDRLENSSIRKMFAADEKQRAEVGSALEVFLASSLHDSRIPTNSHAQRFVGQEADSEVEEHVGSKAIGMFLLALSFGQLSAQSYSCLLQILQKTSRTP